MSKISEDYFIPHKVDTPKNERLPIYWNQVDAIFYKTIYRSPSNSESSGHYDHYLQMHLKKLHRIQSLEEHSVVLEYLEDLKIQLKEYDREAGL